MARYYNFDGAMGNPVEDYNETFSYYHYWVLLLLFAARVPLIWHTTSGVFLFPPMDFYCNDTNITDPGISTKNYCPCDNPSWDRSDFLETVQSKYGLNCDRAALKLWITGSIFSFGAVFGSFSFGFLSDIYGRLPLFTWAVLFMAVFGFLGSVMTNLSAFMVMRWLEGVGAGGTIGPAFILVIEYCGIKRRERIAGLYYLSDTVGQTVLPGISYYFKDCDEFLMAISLPMFVGLILKFNIQESPMWLMDTGQIDKCNKVIEEICKYNVQSPDSLKADIEAYNVGRTQQREVFWHIFRVKSLSTYFYRMSLVFFMNGISVYGVLQLVGEVTEHVRLNIAYSGFMYIISVILGAVLFALLGRKTFTMATNFVASALMLIFILMPENFGWPRVMLGCLCNASFFTAYMIMLLYGLELLPTSVRGALLGILMTWFRCGVLCAPLIIKSLGPTASEIFLTLLPMVGALVVVPLPEPKGKPLPETLVAIMEDEDYV